MNRGFVDGATLKGETRLTPEVCIIGSGAGGAVCAATLASAGKDVLVVEEGGHRTRADFNMREDVAFRNLYEDGGLRATGDAGISILQGRTVGGTTVINWTTCFRTPDSVIDHWKRVHSIGAITSADLAPHFESVEERLNIREMPLEESNRNNRLLYDGAKAIGLDPRPTKRNTRQCMKSGYCGMGCPVDAKQSMLVTYLPDAIAKGASVLSSCRIDRLESAGGRIVRAHGTLLGADTRTPTGEKVVIEAKRFIVSAGAINTPALLLRSGLGGGVVGKRTFLHPVVGVSGRYKDPVEAFYGAPQSIACHSLAHRGDDVGMFLEAAPMHPMMLSLASPGFGVAHRKIMETLPRLAAHVVLAIDGFHASETGGTVTLRPSGAPKLDYELPPRVFAALREGTKQLARINFAAGAEAVTTAHDPMLELANESELHKIDAAPFESGRVAVFSAHVMGGCAMGDDPKTSVVRSSDLRHHTFENLHVMDGSVFPTSLGVNPSESIYGLARLASTRLLAAW